MPPIFVITGQLAAGKSSLARTVLARYPLGYHIDVDGIREMVVSGLAGPLEWTDETSRQFRLALAGSAALADVYHRAGFAVVIEGGLDPADIGPALADVGLHDNLVGVVLHPALDVALKRNRERDTKSFDTRVLEGVMHAIDADLREQPPPAGWTVIDNGAESIEATAERVIALAPAIDPGEGTATTAATDAEDAATADDAATAEAPAGVRQMRLVVTTEDYDRALAFYRDVLGLRELGAFAAEGGRVTILDSGRATLELTDPPHAAYIDRVEVGRRVAGHLRVAFEVTDSREATRRLVDAGAELVAAPTETPWRSLNARLEAPAGLQLTLFQELEPEF